MRTRKKGFDWNKKESEVEKCLRIAWQEVERVVSLHERLKRLRDHIPKYPSGAKSGLISENGPELVYTVDEVKPITTHRILKAKGNIDPDAAERINQLNNIWQAK